MLEGYSTSAPYDALSLNVVTTYWKPASTTSSLDLPSVGCETFFKVTRISPLLPNSGQVSGSSKTMPCLHSDLLDLCSRSSMFDFVHAEGDFFLLWITVHPTRP
jgi:hypothetical protein